MVDGFIGGVCLDRSCLKCFLCIDSSKRSSFITIHLWIKADNACIFTSRKSVVHDFIIFNSNRLMLMASKTWNFLVSYSYLLNCKQAQNETVRKIQVKDPVPYNAKSHMIYQINCTSGHKYIGRTNRRSGTMMFENILPWLAAQLKLTARTAIIKHIKEANHNLTIDEPFKVVL